jgi:hypothetical protein
MGHKARFFTRQAARLAASDVASLRFDLPGHTESEGRQEELSLAGVLSAILRRALRVDRVVEEFRAVTVAVTDAAKR